MTNITGIDDPDVSDSREVVPGDEGEFVYDSWYRGRTFVMTGQIQAGSLGVLKRLERDLKAAFAPLVEAPMKFRWFDIYDSFDDPQTLENYTALNGSASDLFASAGVLRWATTQSALLMRSADNRLWADAQTTLRVIVASLTDSSSVFIVPKLADTADYLQITYKPTAGTLTISTVVGGTTYVLASTSITGILQGQSVWLRAKTEGDLVTAELWTTAPAENQFPQFTTSYWLAGSDADTFGNQVMSQIGFGADTGSVNWAFDDFNIASLCPCDISYWVKKLSSLSIKDSQDAMTRFVRSFQITMRASKPYARCATQSRSQTLVPVAGGTTEFGFSSPLIDPLKVSGFVPGTVTATSDLLFINNRGTAPNRPLLVVYGAISNFTIVNLANNQQLGWTYELLDGDYLLFDCANRTLVNSTGSDMKAYLSLSVPQWMWLEPGWNDIYITGIGYSANTKLVAFYRSAWM